MNIIKQLLKKIGMDKAIAYSSGARVVQAFTGVGSVFFISTFLTGVEQGFYYTFGSIVGIQVFFELGLTNIITQYVAHEAAHLELKEDNEFYGDDTHKSRLSYLLHFSMKWYSLIALALFIVLLVSGFLFFNSYGEKDGNGDVSWQIPWILVSLATAIKLFQAPFNSFIMGIGKVKEMSKVSFFQQLVIPTSSWLGLIIGCKLYVVGISSFLGVLVWHIYVSRTTIWPILYRLWKVKITERVDYMKEIFPYQWKIALSWVSGYFETHLFNPILFATTGAVVAGQMGMTMQAIMAVQSFSLSWINTKVPLFSGLISTKQYIQLDKVFNLTMKQMVSMCAFLMMCLGVFLVFLNYTQLRIGNTVLIERFLPFAATIILSFAIFCNQFINGWATYCRCHKKEPYLVNSIVIGIASTASVFILGTKFGLYGIVGGYSTIAFLNIPWAYYIYKTKKMQWHK